MKRKEGAKEIYQILLAIVLSPSVMSLIPQPHIMHGIPSLLELYNCCNANRHLNKYLWLALIVQCIWVNACLKNYSNVTFMWANKNLSTHLCTQVIVSQLKESMVKMIGDQIFDGQLTVPKEEENGEFIWCTSIFISPVINVDVWEVKHILLNDIIWMEFLA